MEHLITPFRDPLELAEAFEELRKSAWYLHPGERGVYYFSDQENLTKRLEKEAKDAPENKIEEEMRRRLLDMFEAKRKHAYEQALALPRLDDVNLKTGRVLLILSPDTKIPPEEAKRFFEAVTQKNNFCIVAGDGSSLASLENAVRRCWAIAKVDMQLPATHPQKTDLEDKREEAEHDFRSTAIATFNRLYFPMKDGLKLAKFSATFNNNAWEGESQIEQSLEETAASKLVVDVPGQAERLMQRRGATLGPRQAPRALERCHRACEDQSTLALAAAQRAGATPAHGGGPRALATPMTAISTSVRPRPKLRWSLLIIMTRRLAGRSSRSPRRTRDPSPSFTTLKIRM